MIFFDRQFFFLFDLPCMCSMYKCIHYSNQIKIRQSNDSIVYMKKKEKYQSMMNCTLKLAVKNRKIPMFHCLCS